MPARGAPAVDQDARRSSAPRHDQHGGRPQAAHQRAAASRHGCRCAGARPGIVCYQRRLCRRAASPKKWPMPAAGLAPSTAGGARETRVGGLRLNDMRASQKRKHPANEPAGQDQSRSTARMNKRLIIIGGKEDKKGSKEILRAVAKQAGSGLLAIATLASTE